MSGTTTPRQGRPVRSPGSSAEGAGVPELEPLAVVVLGSLNLDLVLTATKIPRPGETVLASSLTRMAGGKGANQAVAAARLGADVTLIGRLGDDSVGREIRVELTRTGVRLDHLREIGGVSSGLAVVTVDPQGENAIVVSPGANHELTPEELSKDESALAMPVIAVAQLETPLATVSRFAEVAVDSGAQLVLNAAPFAELPAELLRRCAYLVVNRDEAGSLTGSTVRTRGDAVAALEQLVARGAQAAVVTLGSQGCLALTKEGLLEIAAYQVSVVDTTGAGDAFVGAFAAALARQADPGQALRFAAAAGAVTCRVAGAQQDGLSYAQVRELIREQPAVQVHRAAENVSSQ